MRDTILAIDLGRYKSVACVYDRGTRGHTFRTVDMTPEGVDRLLARHPGALVVVEACANAGWVADRAAAAESWKFKHLERKTDRDDALRLAELEAIGQLPTVTLPDPDAAAVGTREQQEDGRKDELRQAILDVLPDDDPDGMTRDEIWNALPRAVRKNENRFKSVIEAECGRLWRKEGTGGKGNAYRYRRLRAVTHPGEEPGGEE